MTEERREARSNVLAISSDDLWCKFVRNTLRRTDEVLEAKSFMEAETLSRSGNFEIIFFSNELVPRSMAELEQLQQWCPSAKVVVLFDLKDSEEMHISRKHLAQLSIDAEEKPTESKALRRVIKHALQEHVS